MFLALGFIIGKIDENRELVCFGQKKLGLNGFRYVYLRFRRKISDACRACWLLSVCLLNLLVC